MQNQNQQFTILLSEGQAPQVMPVFEAPRKVLNRYFDRFDVVNAYGYDFWVHDEFLFHITPDSVPSVVIEDENHRPWQALFGNVLVFKTNDEGETLPLDTDDIERLAHLLNPIVFKRGETQSEKLGTVVRI